MHFNSDNFQIRLHQTFILGLIDKQIEEKQQHDALLTTAQLFNVLRWKDSQIPTMEEWMLKVMDLVEMAKLTSSVEKDFVFVSIWKPFSDFLLKTETNETLTLVFDDQICL